jgi:hypothetical protein
LQEAEAHAHIDAMQSLGELDAYAAKAVVFVGIALDGIL